MTPNYTLSLPGGHTFALATTPGDDPPDAPVRGGMGVGMASSRLWVRLDDGPWTLSERASMAKVLHRWLDIPASDIPAAWEWTTGEALGWRVCEGCGERKPDARVVDGSDEWWCRGCRS
jgi:hypothetical protein